MGNVVTLSELREARGWSCGEERLLRSRETALRAMGLDAVLDIGKAEDGAAWAVEAIGEVIVRSYSKERGRIGVLDADGAPLFKVETLEEALKTVSRGNA